MPISIMLLFFASLRVLRELRANQLALRSLRGSRQHRRSREVREDREGTRRTATPGVVSQRVQVKMHIWIAKQSLPLNRQRLYEILQILSLTLFEQVPIHQLLTPPPSYSDADFEPIQLVLL
ncbi:hypothetical protein [Gemmatimonas sp.]|uniref:hypothetical protein n=1 Tax=Gemmatimonas sp. TaxID=1962908 RepID=UPI003569423C